MSTDSWRFLAELLRQLDDGVEATGHMVAAALGIDDSAALTQLRALLRRGLVEETPGPRRLGDSSLDFRLEVTSDGVRTATSGRVD